MIPLIWASWISHIHKDRKWNGDCRGGGRRSEEVLVSGHRVSVLQGEKSSGDGRWWWLHNNVNVLYTTELYIEKRWSGKFCYAYFTTIKKLGKQNIKPWPVIPNPGLFPALHGSAPYRGAASRLFLYWIAKFLELTSMETLGDPLAFPMSYF